MAGGLDSGDVMTEKCPLCNGYGEIYAPYIENNVSGYVPCPRCGGCKVVEVDDPAPEESKA